jgi:hypothetical protein
MGHAHFGGMGGGMRWNLSHMPEALNYAGAVLIPIGFFIVWLTFRENSFAAPVMYKVAPGYIGWRTIPAPSGDGTLRIILAPWRFG